MFNHSSLLNDDLLKSQESVQPLVLIQNVITRWNSAYAMIERFIILFDSVKSVLNATTADKYEIHRTRINRMNKKVINLLKAIVIILRPFHKLTKILSSEKYTTLSIVLHSCYYLEKKLSELNQDPLLNGFRLKLLAAFEKYMETYGVLTEEFLCSSTFCNPMYWDLVHCTEKEKYETHKIATDFIKNYFDHYAKTSSKSENESDDSADSFSGLSKNKKKVLGSQIKAVQDIVEM